MKQKLRMETPAQPATARIGKRGKDLTPGVQEEGQEKGIKPATWESPGSKKAVPRSSAAGGYRGP